MQSCTHSIGEFGWREALCPSPTCHSTDRYELILHMLQTDFSQLRMTYFMHPYHCIVINALSHTLNAHIKCIHAHTNTQTHDTYTDTHSIWLMRTEHRPQHTLCPKGSGQRPSVRYSPPGSTGPFQSEWPVLETMDNAGINRTHLPPLILEQEAKAYLKVSD